MQRVGWLKGTILAGLLLQGCLVVYDPFLGSGAVTTTWTIDGGTANASSCDAAGIDTVEIEVYRRGGSIAHTTSALRANCSAGSLNSGPLLSIDDYDFVVVGRSATGAEVARTERFRGEIVTGDETLEIETINFEPEGTPPPTGFDPRGSDHTSAAEWLINGAAATTESCAAAGIATVGLIIWNEAEDESFEFEFDCADGGFDSRSGGDPMFRAGMFANQWVARDSSGAAVAGPSPDTPNVLNTATNDHSTLQGPDFVVAVPLELEVTLAFEVTDGAMDYGTCAEAGVTSFGFELTDGTGASVDSMFGVMPCNEVLTWSDAVVMSGGEYALNITGDADDGTKWGTDCTGLSVASGREQYNCTVDITM